MVNHGRDDPTSGTVAGLLAYLAWAVRNDEISASTAAAYQTAVTQVLQDGPDWKAASVVDLDVESVISRFRSRSTGRQDVTVRSYEDRVRAAISGYCKFLRRTHERGVVGAPRGQVAGPAAGDQLVEYPFPVRSGVMAYLSLPRDLSASEARRVAAFVASLAVDEEPEGGG